MSRNYIGDYTFNGAFEAGIAAPMDARYVVEYFADLISENTWPKSTTGTYIYEGMQVYVKEEKKVYILTDVANYQSESSWKELVSDVEGTSIEIADTLHSTSTEAALSANQGRVLDKKITSLEDKIFDGEKIDTSLLPEFNTGLLYGGTIDKDGICTLTKALKEKLGLAESTPTKPIVSLSVAECADVYFIASEAGIAIKIDNTNNLTLPERSAGDWIISNGSKWEKIASNAVTSVVGKTGAITRTQLLDELEYKSTDSNPAVGGFIRKTEINRLDGSISGLGESLGSVSTRVSSVENKLTWKTIQ